MPWSLLREGQRAAAIMAGAVSQLRLGCRLGACACFQHARVPLFYIDDAIVVINWICRSKTTDNRSPVMYVRRSVRTMITIAQTNVHHHDRKEDNRAQRDRETS